MDELKVFRIIIDQTIDENGDEWTRPQIVDTTGQQVYPALKEVLGAMVIGMFQMFRLYEEEDVNEDD
jgi:hypothetical protein